MLKVSCFYNYIFFFIGIFCVYICTKNKKKQNSKTNQPEKDTIAFKDKDRVLNKE